MFGGAYLDPSLLGITGNYDRVRQEVNKALGDHNDYYQFKPPVGKTNLYGLQ